MKVSALMLLSICTTGAALSQNITVPYSGATGSQPLYLQTPGPASIAAAATGASGGSFYLQPRTLAPDTGSVPAATAAARLASELGLDRRETVRLQVILDEQQLKLDEFLRAQETSGRRPTAETVMAVQRKLQDESMNELRSVLTPEHLQRLTAMGGGRRLLAASNGILVRAHPAAAYCDATGKCVAR